MAIHVLEIFEATERGCRCRVRHGNNELVAEIACDPAEARSYGDAKVFVELSFTAAESVRIVSGDVPHGIFAAGDATRLVGKVHNIVPLDDGGAIYDVYLVAGPEFFGLDDDDLAGVILAVGDSVEAVVSGLCFYPTRV